MLIKALFSTACWWASAPRLRCRLKQPRRRTLPKQEIDGRSTIASRILAITRTRIRGRDGVSSCSRARICRQAPRPSSIKSITPIMLSPRAVRGTTRTATARRAASPASRWPTRGIFRAGRSIKVSVCHFRTAAREVPSIVRLNEMAGTSWMRSRQYSGFETCSPLTMQITPRWPCRTPTTRRRRRPSCRWSRPWNIPSRAARRNWRARRR